MARSFLLCAIHFFWGHLNDYPVRSGYVLFFFLQSLRYLHLRSSLMKAHLGETRSTCRLLRAQQPFIGKQGLDYAVGISAETVGATVINLQLVTIAPGAKAKTHMHAGHETAIYALTGVSHVWYGSRLEEHATVVPGDFFYIPAGVPHQPYNNSNEPAVVLVARSDPNDQESVIMLPELDVLHP
ncbi:cupin domain-containing protein [Xylella fastidiosa subsp. multiplex]|uniref:cupin domain-containing protein n=1 Tax=Xylella fastidiosa TaxID=2371 RepID=UPI0035D3DC5C